jgi:tripartite-type tricarboxylate transporter receptor subunit TctC
MKRSGTWIAAGSALMAALACPLVAAADFPTKPVTVVIGYPAGGATDVFMRAIAPRLSKEWNQQVIVENRPGANEAIAAQHVARSPADGYTLFMCTEMPLTINPFLFKKLAYEPEKNFTPVTWLVAAPLTLAVPASLPVSSLQEFVALAKARSASGKPLSFGSSGAGSVLHFPMAMLAERNGAQMTHVPYKGVAPLVTDLVAGQIDSAWIAVPNAAPFVRDGRLKALVVGAPSRVKALPDVPVFKDTPVAAVQADFIFAIVAPTGTPAAVVEKISGDIRKIVNDPDFRAEFADPFGFVTQGSTPPELARHLEKDRVVQAERVKVSGASLD